jgi:hypothetical protein
MFKISRQSEAESGLHNFAIFKLYIQYPVPKSLEFQVGLRAFALLHPSSILVQTLYSYIIYTRRPPNIYLNIQVSLSLFSR